MRDEANTEVASYLKNVACMSALVSQCALATANYTNLYREPGQSISDIDERLGSQFDVEDPLLSAHRLAKFYLISAGDCVHSMSTLLSVDYPNFIGAAAIARSAAEHASRSIYLTDSNIMYQARLIRISLLVASSLREYKTSHDVAATTLIEKWGRWRARNSRELSAVPKQKLPNATGLIKRYFASYSEFSYEELSRPTHGNAAWLAITVISEQKATAFSRILLMRNAMFATRCVVDATASLAILWGLDLDEVLDRMADEMGLETGTTWTSVVNEVHALSEFVDSIDERQFVDTTTDPQPRR